MKSLIYIDSKAPAGRNLKSSQRKVRLMSSDEADKIRPGEVIVRVGQRNGTVRSDPKLARAMIWDGEMFKAIGRRAVPVATAVNKADAALALLRRGVDDLDAIG
jgi:hypothetical protein